MKNNWEHLTIMAKKKVSIKDCECFILSSKEEDEKNAETIKRFIQYVNEKPISELRAMDVVDRVIAIMEVSKMIQKEATIVKAEECLERVAKDVVSFDSEFKPRVRDGFPNCWDLVEGLIMWEKFNKMLAKDKSGVDSFHEKTSSLKGRTIVNYIRRYF